jgi:hypothetical protein
MKDEKDTKLVELTSVQGEMEENLVLGILKGEGIDALVKSDRAGGALPFTMDGMGKVRIYVREDELEKAKELLNEFEGEK